MLILFGASSIPVQRHTYSKIQFWFLVRFLTKSRLLRPIAPIPHIPQCTRAVLGKDTLCDIF